eukprot:1788128-Prymnesium_polylepis.1
MEVLRERGTTAFEFAEYLLVGGADPLCLSLPLVDIFSIGDANPPHVTSLLWRSPRLSCPRTTRSGDSSRRRASVAARRVPACVRRALQQRHAGGGLCQDGHLSAAAGALLCIIEASVGTLAGAAQRRPPQQQ